MVTIIAEKASVGNKIAAALDVITLNSGKKVSFKDLESNIKAVEAQQNKDGYLKISFHGEECYVTWAMGHLVELKQAKDYNADYANWKKMPMPFIPSKYETQLKQMPKAKDKFNFNTKIKKQFGIIKDLMRKSGCVINATDNDREGEVIFAYIYRYARCKAPVKRAAFDSTTKTAIEKAFNALEPDSKRELLRKAGEMRNIADWVVGSNLTAAMTLSNNASDDILSVGRVQTPTLNMLVQRELAIRKFKGVKYWTITADFCDAATGKKKYKAEHTAKRFDIKLDAEKIIKKIDGQQGLIKSVDKKNQKKEAPNLYSLSSLQMEANALYGFTLKQTLEIAQSLYDKGYTTYPRTKSQYLTEDMEPVVNGVLDALQALPDYNKLIAGRKRSFDRKRYFDNSKVDSHYAIIPTGTIPTGLTAQQQKIFDLIARSVIKMLYGPATLERTTVSTDVKGEIFTSSGVCVLDPGWMVCGGGVKETSLPYLVSGEVVNGLYKLNEKETEPPKRYTEKTILAAMISAGKDLKDDDLKKILSDPSVNGIGTEATRAAIIETLVARGYIERKGKSLYATDKGIELINTLPLEDLKSAEITARWEQRLSDITTGKEKPEIFQKDIEKTLSDWCAKIIKAKATISVGKTSGTVTTGLKCPVCGAPVVKQKWGWGCSAYKSGCKFSLSGVILKKKISDSQCKKLIETGSTGMIKGFTSNKSGKKFDAELVLKPDGKAVFKFAK